jgi:hypothetical protein
LNEIEFEILAGLPASGPPAVAFPPNNLGFSEGLVIRVRCSPVAAWVGNFQYGENDHSAVYKHPDGKRLIVVAGGSYYLVDPLTKGLTEQSPNNITFSCEVPEVGVVVFGDHIRFWAEGKDARMWSTSRLSWDGFAEISVMEGVLTGKWYSAIDEEWHEFRLDLSSGDIVGATFEADFRRVKPIAKM